MTPNRGSGGEHPGSALGPLLRQHRLRAGLSQEHLAQLAQVGVRTIRELEQGRVGRPQRQSVALLAQALGLEGLAREAFERTARGASGGQPLFPESARVPVPLPGIIGRDEHLRALTDTISGDPPRLLTLTGVAGVGKTRLAIAVARSVEQATAWPVCWVPLARSADAVSVGRVISDVLCVKPDRWLSELIALTRHHDSLLVLDGVERFASAGEDVNELMASCSRLRVLCTSIRPLRVTSEREWPLDALAVPPPGMDGDVRRLASVPAVQLLVERIQAIRPTFQLTDANAAPIAALCRRLDGLPLAIELAAGRLRALTPDELVRLLDEQLLSLASDSIDRPARHATLRDAIRASYACLDTGEQRALCGLAVFSGGWTAASAAAVASGGQAEPDGISLHEALTANGLVRADEIAGASRYTMLDTIRAFALERLSEGADGGESRRRHARHFGQLAERLGAMLTGSAQAAALQELDVETENVRVALRWCTERDPHLGLRTAIALLRYWLVRGRYGEGRQWLDVLAQNAGTDPGREGTILLARARRALAVLAGNQGDLVAARSYGLEALAAFEWLGVDDGVMDSLICLGGIALFAGDYLEVDVRSRRCVEVAVRARHPEHEATALNNLGVAANITGRHDEAAVLLRRCWSIRDGLGDRRGAAMALTNLGETARYRGHLAEAQEILEEALRSLQASGYVYGRSIVLSTLATVVAGQADPNPAQALAAEAMQLAARMDNPQALGVASLATAEVALAGGRPGGARLAFRQALPALRAAGDFPMLAEALEGFASCANPTCAARLVGTADALRMRHRLARPRYLEARLREVSKRARAEIGSSGWSDEVRAGQGLSMDEAMAEVAASSTPRRNGSV